MQRSTKSSPLWIQNSSVVSYTILLNGLVTQSVTTGHGNPLKTTLMPTTQLLSSTGNIHLRHVTSLGISTIVPSLNFTTLLSTMLEPITQLSISLSPI